MSALPAPIGILGGTFDPIHFGHLRLAEEATDTLGLAGVRLIPAGRPPHRDIPAASAEHRLAMTRIAAADNPQLVVDAAEVEAASPSYTVPTLERLRRELGPDRPLVLLLGADAFAGLATWHRWRDLFGLAHLAVTHRPGYGLDEDRLPAAVADEWVARRRDTAGALGEAPAGAVLPFAITPLDISATRIRQTVAAGRSPRYLLPDAVVEYIRCHRLYR